MYAMHVGLDDTGSSALQQVHATLLDRVAAMEAQFEHVRAKLEGEDVTAKRLSFAILGEVQRSESLRQEAEDLEAENRNLEAAWVAKQGGSPEERQLKAKEVQRENEELRQELRRLRVDISREEELARLQSEAEVQERLTAQLRRSLKEAEAEGARLEQEADALRPEWQRQSRRLGDTMAGDDLDAVMLQIGGP